MQSVKLCAGEGWFGFFAITLAINSAKGKDVLRYRSSARGVSRVSYLADDGTRFDGREKQWHVSLASICLEASGPILA